jgi:alpha-methylacyl-CoA racemase
VPFGPHAGSAEIPVAAPPDVPSSGPLAGTRVIELAGIGPGPFAAMVLADLGAQVLRVDRHDRSAIVPDATRPDAPTGEARAENPYDVLNRSRRRVAVDLRSEAGSELVLDLAEGADVLIEGFRPGVAERFGVGPEQCAARNPRLVYGRMTGWGQHGPLAQAAGHDINYLARAGALAHIGRLGQPPTPPLNLVGDFGGGAMLLVTGILAALVERGTSGRGQVVDAAMVDGAALLMAPLFGAWASGFWSAERGTNLLDSGAPFYDCYRCADGRWVAVGAIEARFYDQLLEGLGLSGDPSLPAQHDQARWPELRSRLADAFGSRSRDEWADHFAGRDACVSPVLDMGEATEDAAAVARGAFPSVGGVPQPAPAPRFSRTAAPPPEPAVDADDAVAVLGDWGIHPTRALDLEADGVIG